MSRSHLRNLLLSGSIALLPGVAPLAAQTAAPRVRPGIDVFLADPPAALKGKRLGLITNPSGLTSGLRSTIDALHACPDIKLTALFGPEHGVRGDRAGGEAVDDAVDARTGIPMFSLYGRTHAPTVPMLRNVDVLVYDIQDVGARSYTFVWTMAKSMAAAKAGGKAFVVLDRPDPLGGVIVDGNVLDPAFSSMVGLHPVAYVYGMTPGELARFVNAECGIGCDLTVIPMAGWRRGMLYRETGLAWVPPSPHIPTPETAFGYPATGIMGELGTVNEGVGYTLPFQIFGADWLDGDGVAAELNRRKLPGVHFRPMQYKPFYFRFEGKVCRGAQIVVTDPVSYRPVQVQLHVLEAILKRHPDREIFAADRVGMFDKVMGTDAVRKALLAGKSADEIIRGWEAELAGFRKKRDAHLLYK